MLLVGPLKDGVSQKNEHRMTIVRDDGVSLLWIQKDNNFTGIHRLLLSFCFIVNLSVPGQLLISDASIYRNHAPQIRGQTQ